MSRPRAGAILLAAGAGRRMRGLDKTLAPLGGLPVAAHSLKAFAACLPIDEVVIVCSAANHAPIAELAAAWGGGKVVALVRGGARRRDSVAAGLRALGPVDLVAVHDVARPLVSEMMIAQGLRLADQQGAAIAGAPISDTIKAVDAEGRVTRTIDRAGLRAAQTPQCFRRDLLERAHAGGPPEATDDAALVEALGHPVVVYDSGGVNPKITTPEDLLVLEALLAARAATPASSG